MRDSLDPQSFGDTRIPSGLARDGYVADASGIDLTKPARIIVPRDESDVRKALDDAHRDNLTVTAAGARHSMGGQALQDGAVLLDMRRMDALSYRGETQTIIVEPGATWASLQRELDRHGRAIRVMQSSNIFTVGGSLAVNAHGRDVRFGPLVEGVESIDVILADGQIVHASRAENSGLFRHAIGGYGLFGVIVRAELSTAENEIYQSTYTHLSLSDFVASYDARIDVPEKAGDHPVTRLMGARLSIDPDSLFQDVLLVEHSALSAPPVVRPVDQRESHGLDFVRRLAFQIVGARLPKGKKALWWLETHVEPRLNGRWISRNQAMSPPVEFLRSASRTHAQVLQEYFVPRSRLTAFLERLSPLVLQHRVNVIHANLRRIQPDTVTALPYARDEGFAIVLYIDQKNARDPKVQIVGDRQIVAFTQEVADAALAVGGTFYLPYRLQFTKEQVRCAYPGIRSFFQTKHLYDPDSLFENALSRSYGDIQ